MNCDQSIPELEHFFILTNLCVQKANYQPINSVTDTFDSVRKGGYFNQIHFWQMNTKEGKYIHI